MQIDTRHHATTVADDPSEAQRFDTGSYMVGTLKRTAGGHDATAYDRGYHARSGAAAPDHEEAVDAGRAK